MVLNYFIMFARLLKRHSVYYSISILGLTAGILSFVMILVYCSFEYSYDDFHQNHERIYRIVGGSARTPNPLSQAMADEISAIEQGTRMIFSHSGMVVLDSSGNAFEEKGYAVDSTFLLMFNFDFIRGQKTALNDIKNVVVTRNFAIRIFGTTDVVGRVIQLDAMVPDPTYTIAAVIENPPENSQFEFDILTRYTPHSNIDNWENNLVYTYVLLRDNSDRTSVEDQVKALFKKRSKTTDNDAAEIVLQSLQEQHFDTSRTFDFGPHTAKQGITILISLGALILVIGCINFVNLSTAKSMERKKEVGMRKVVGANRKQLILQFISESVLISCCAFFLAVCCIYLLMPLFRVLTGIEFLTGFQSLNYNVILFLVLLPFILGLVAGLYPALIISSFYPIDNLHSEAGINKSPCLRKILVTVQFAVTAFLFVGTLTVLKQFSFIKNKDLGFSDEQVIVLNVGFPGIRDKIQSIKTELSKNPNVINVSAALTVPGDLTYTMPYSIRETLDNDEDRLSWAGLYVDPDFVSNMEIDVIEGRTFSGNMATDTLSFLLNETAVQTMVEKYGDQWKNPLGKTLNYFRSDNTGYYLAKPGRIIGVVKDFNYYSLHQKVNPLAIQVDYKLLFKLLVKVNSHEIPQTIESVKEVWNKFGITKPFNFVFLDEHFGKAYEKEVRFKRIFITFSIISLLISAGGLYGLVLFTSGKRSKEMSVRRVFGADPVKLLLLLTTDFLKPILVAFILIVPFAWWSMNNWLNQFAYHTQMEASVFVWAALVCFFIAIVTICSRTIQVLKQNPVRYLRQN
jgi:putative ABC transport system permease protein